MPAVAPQQLAGAPDGEPSAAVAERVAAARARALERQGCANGELAGQALDRHAAPGAAAARFLQASALRLGWSARSFHRVLRCARTIADLAGSREIETPHIAEAIQFRRAL